MVERLAVVWSTYLTRPNFAAIGLGVLILLSLASAHPVLALMLLPTVYLVGDHVRHGLGNPLARVLPNYRTAHLLVPGMMLAGVWLLSVGNVLGASQSWSFAVFAVSVVMSLALTLDQFVTPKPLLWSLRTGILVVAAVPLWYSGHIWEISSTELVSFSKWVEPWQAGLAALYLVLISGVTAWRVSQLSRVLADVSPQDREEPRFGSVFLRPSRPPRPQYHEGRWFRRLRLWRHGQPSTLQDVALASAFCWWVLLDDNLTFWMLAIIMAGGSGVLQVGQQAQKRQDLFGQEWLRPVSRRGAINDYLLGIAWDLLTIPVVIISMAVAMTLLGRNVWTTWWPLVALPAAYLLAVGLVALSTAVRLSHRVAVGLVIGGIIVAVISAAMLMDGLPSFISEPPLWLMVASCAAPALAGIVMTGIARQLWLQKELR